MGSGAEAVADSRVASLKLCIHLSWSERDFAKKVMCPLGYRIYNRHIRMDISAAASSFASVYLDPETQVILRCIIFRLGAG